MAQELRQGTGLGAGTHVGAGAGATWHLRLRPRLRLRLGLSLRLRLRLQPQLCPFYRRSTDSAGWQWRYVAVHRCTWLCLSRDSEFRGDLRVAPP